MAAALDIGLAGAGRLGSALGERLLAAGHRLRFHDPHPEAGGALEAAGAERVATPAALAAAPLSLSVVTDGPALLTALLGADGIAAAASPGHVHVAMSTVAPATIIEAARRAEGLVLIDAPVSGSVAHAREGRLTAIVGARPEDLERAQPLLRELTAAQHLVGDVGAGSALKLAVNSVVAATNQGVAEALLLAGAAGIPAQTAYEVLLASVVSSPYLEYKRAAFLDPEGPVGGSVAMLAKDVGLALAAAADAGLDLPLATTTHTTLHEAAERGLAAHDVAAVLLALAPEAQATP